MSDKHPGGRPRIIESPEEFEERAAAYFAQCADSGEFLTVTGLALAVGFADRQSLYDYQARPEFSGVVKRARLKVEHDYERRLATSSPTGAIFALKNMGWSDRQQFEHSGPDGGPIQTEQLSNASEEDLKAQIQALNAALEGE